MTFAPSVVLVPPPPLELAPPPPPPLELSSPPHAATSTPHISAAHNIRTKRFVTTLPPPYYLVKTWQIMPSVRLSGCAPCGRVPASLLRPVVQSYPAPPARGGDAASTRG